MRRFVLIIGVLTWGSAGCTPAGDLTTAEPASVLSAATLTRAVEDAVPAESSPGRAAVLERELRASAEVRALIGIREELSRRARLTGATPDAVRRAYAEGDLKTARALLGMSEAEERELAARLAALRSSLLRAYPELAGVERAEGGVANARRCEALIAARQVARGKTAPASGEVFSLEGDHEIIDSGTCQWVQYTAALLVCSSIGPVLYWPCAYVAYCSFCGDDPLAATLCR